MLHAGNRGRISLLGAEYDPHFLEWGRLHAAFSCTRDSAFRQRRTMNWTANPG